MNATLLEEEDRNSTSLFFEMNVYNTGFLKIVGETEEPEHERASPTFVFENTIEGIEKAQHLVDALQTWISHVNPLSLVAMTLNAVKGRK